MSSRPLPGVVLAVLLATGLALTACTDSGAGASPPSPPQVPTTEALPSPPAPTSPTPSPTPPTTEPAPTPPPEFDADAAFAIVEHLAGEIGPREAASDAFHEAAAYVEERFESLGYQVRQVPVPVPAGERSYRPEWGTVLEAGTSANVVADSPGFDPARPHVVIGAHLDTVAVAPGAEDNASGIAVVLELARLAAAAPPDIAVRFIAFGAEEPRGAGDSMHHFGSQLYVRELSDEDREQVVAMVSLDRVGVPSGEVPVCTGGAGPVETRTALLDAADGAGVAARSCENRASDHWSFEKAGIAAARLGSIPYGGYHSPGDVPDVVDAYQLERAGTIVWTWLQRL